MKNGKYKLDANQIRQICLGLARGKSFRAISRQTGLSINRVNRTAGRIQAVSGGKPEELVNLDDHQLAVLKAVNTFRILSTSFQD